MSRPRSPHTGDLDAVLRDDLALEQIGRGRRPRGADNALKALCAIAEDVEIKVPRRRTRGSRLTRGLLATTVAATVLGATGVAAAEPGGSNSFAFWSPRPGDHIQAADRSLTEAQRSLQRGDEETASQHLDEVDEELRKAGSSTHRAALEERASDLRDQTEPGEATPRTLPTADPTWSWAWGIPGGGPGWQPGKDPYERECLLILCRTKKSPPDTSVPQKTPGASAPKTKSSKRDFSLSSLFRAPSSTATPSTPSTPGPGDTSSESKPDGDESSTAPAPTSSPSGSDSDSGEPSPSESSSAPGVLPSASSSDSSSPSDSESDSETEDSEEPEPRTSASG